MAADSSETSLTEFDMGIAAAMAYFCPAALTEKGWKSLALYSSGVSVENINALWNLGDTQEE